MFAHLTLPTQHVEGTTRFVEITLGYRRKTVPSNSPIEVSWLDIGYGQELHIVFVEAFAVSPYEEECGRHVALFHPRDDFTALRERIGTAGGQLIVPLRETSFQRSFFREPVNGYLFEVIEAEWHQQLLAEGVATARSVSGTA